MSYTDFDRWHKLTIPLLLHIPVFTDDCLARKGATAGKPDGPTIFSESSGGHDFKGIIYSFLSKG
jgi:hypothetical protein